MIYLKDSQKTYKVSQFKDSAIIATIDNVTSDKPCYLVTFIYNFSSYSFSTLRKAQSFIRDNINNIGAYPVIINRNGVKWLSYNNHSLGIISKVKKGNRLFWYNHKVGFIDGSLNQGQLLNVIDEIIQNKR